MCNLQIRGYSTKLSPQRYRVTVAAWRQHMRRQNVAVNMSKYLKVALFRRIPCLIQRLFSCESPNTVRYVTR